VTSTPLQTRATAATEWRALGTSVRLVVTGPALLDSCNLLLARHLAEAGRRTGRAPVVVANGAEGEPASRKDKTLLALSPHLVLDGLQTAAPAVGAQEAYLAVEEGASYLESAAAHRKDPVAVQVVRLPKRFLSGQASALARFVGGGTALPAHQNPPVRERGVGRAPTLVQNVETLAHLALVCAELLPEHITLDEWGYPLVDGTPIPPRTVKRARRAAADCPVPAMKLTSAGAPLQGRGAVLICGSAAWARSAPTNPQPEDNPQPPNLPP
jgi:hypothetical protein